MNKYLFLLKYGEEKHLKQLQSGKLYMNHIGFFKQIPDEVGRFDNMENITDIWQKPNLIKGELLCGNTKIAEIDKISIYIPEHDKNQYTHISSFCLIEIPCKKALPVYNFVDSRIQKFGDSVLLIHNIKEFIDRIMQAVKFNKKMCKCRVAPIQYLPQNYHGSVNIFNKFEQFAYQKEWRCAIRNFKDLEKPFYLNIGSIRDISVLMKTSELGLQCATINNDRNGFDVFFGQMK